MKNAKDRVGGSTGCIMHRVHTSIYIYINKDENPFTKSTRHVEANANTRKQNQEHRKSNNEVKT